MKTTPQHRQFASESRDGRVGTDRDEIAKMFRRLGGDTSESCIAILDRNGAAPINKDALVETAGGATGALKHLLK